MITIFFGVAALAATATAIVQITPNESHVTHSVSAILEVDES